MHDEQLGSSEWISRMMSESPRCECGVSESRKLAGWI